MQVYFEYLAWSWKLSKLGMEVNQLDLYIDDLMYLIFKSLGVRSEGLYVEDAAVQLEKLEKIEVIGVVATMARVKNWNLD